MKIKTEIMKFSNNQLNLTSKTSTKFHQNQTHFNGDIGKKAGQRQSPRQRQTQKQRQRQTGTNLLILGAKVQRLI